MSAFKDILTAVPEADRGWVEREARIYMNCVAIRPSDAARRMVADYQAGRLRRTVIQDGHIVGSTEGKA